MLQYEPGAVDTSVPLFYQESLPQPGPATRLALQSADAQQDLSRHAIEDVQIGPGGHVHTLAQKPDGFFRCEEEGGNLPATLSLELTPAPVAATAREAVALVKQATDEREEIFRQKTYKMRVIDRARIAPQSCPFCSSVGTPEVPQQLLRQRFARTTCRGRCT